MRNGNEERLKRRDHGGGAGGYAKAHAEIGQAEIDRLDQKPDRRQMQPALSGGGHLGASDQKDRQEKRNDQPEPQRQKGQRLRMTEADLRYAETGCPQKKKDGRCDSRHTFGVGCPRQVRDARRFGTGASRHRLVRHADDGDAVARLYEAREVPRSEDAVEPGVKVDGFGACPTDGINPREDIPRRTGWPRSTSGSIRPSSRRR